MTRIFNLCILLICLGGGVVADLEEDLEAQEDRVMYCLIERLRFKRNWPSYDMSNILMPAAKGSLAQYIVQQMETIQARAGRYIDANELPFLANEGPQVPLPLTYNKKTETNVTGNGAAVNLNSKAWNFYFNDFLPTFAAAGDDGSYNPAVNADLNLLQAFSRRIHFGKHIAEARYSSKPADFDAAIRNKDEAWLWKLLANDEDDWKIKERVKKKVWIFGQNIRLNAPSELKKYADPLKFETFFAKGVIPLCREVQVKYLLGRLV